MREKLRSRRGLTMVELLAAAAVLILLGLMLHTGLLMAQRSYHTMRAESETQLLLATAADLLSNELRYARDVETAPDGALQRYTSVNYGRNTTLDLDDQGRLEAGIRQMLPAGAYGNGDCRIARCDIRYDSGTDIFSIALAVSGRQGISSEREFSIRCLNPAQGAEEGGEAP